MLARCFQPRRFCRRIQASFRRAAALALVPALLTALAPAAPAQAQEVAARAYGDAGTTEAALGLGFGSGYFSAGAGLRYFVVNGVAPGLEGTYQHFDGTGRGLVLGSLRLAPLRFGAVVPVITARGGRVFLSDHADGWAVGGDVGILFLLSPHVAFEVGYGFLRLVPASFCADFVSCTVTQPVFGVRITF